MADRHVVGFILVASGLLIFNHLLKKKKNGLEPPPLPPGPTPLPLLGNILNIKTDEPWVTYTQWGATYGNIVYSRAFGQEVIIINSENVAKALMEKRSHNYSDRPRLATILPFGWDYNTGFQPYADQWRLHRRCLHQAFRENAVAYFRPMQLRKARQLCIDILGDKSQFHDCDVQGVELVSHIQTLAASIIMSATYDYETAPSHDPLVHIVERALDLAIKFMTPEKAALLGVLPILLHLPDWFPGSVKNEATLSQKYSDDMVDMPYQYAVKSIAAGTAGRCMVSETKLEDETGSQRILLEKALKDSAATAFVAGAETTASTLLVFVLMMVLNPRVQEKAQAEIDLVVGNARLPDFTDRPSLPYVDAILRETLRWFPVVPLGMPRVAGVADVYEGYRIPQGAILIPNAWGMSRDEAKYPNASEFVPERFINADGELKDDTVVHSFGFGRRICPGRHLADASLWAGMVSMLTVFKFMKCKDQAGNDMDVHPQWTSGLTSYPRFPCRIVPRIPGLDREALINLIRSSDGV
ncbi:cytochrome P450 [Leucogyrophana mollusca]|uniref:Cytochrome P450 n=1 Tax=Leucogyrophana mollusca TaxID=85980 RepID=A0ACB8BKS8_9AGAM|nr:cytochrome P450 [Leucogyrophana mollusca]